MRSVRKCPSIGSGRRCLMARTMLKKLCITKAYPTFLKIIEIELTGHFGIEKLLKARCQEKNTRPAVATDTCPSLKGLGRDCLCLLIGRA